MRLLVTGGAGFIGSNFVRHVLSRQTDVRVTVLDALTYAGDRANLGDVEEQPRLSFVHGDVCDAGLVDRLLDDHDAIAHFAAESHVDRSIDGPAAFLRTNVSGSGVLFEAARRHGIERVLHVSTDEVYGPRLEGTSVETDPLRPSSPYAASKAGADLLAEAYRTTYDLPVIVTRASNTYGPYQHPEKMIPRFVVHLLRGETMPVYGDGGHVREWLHVDDHVAGQWRVLAEGEPGGTYNLGSGQRRTNREMALALAAAFGRGEEALAGVEDRPGHDRRYALDGTRAHELGFRPRVGLDEGIAATVAWYRRRADWWGPRVAEGGARRQGRR
jgi:dTDP-glucose 4,6-dehydratase